MKFYVVCIGMYQIREANQMVEEFMLAANVEVAEKILKHFPLKVCCYCYLETNPSI